MNKGPDNPQNKISLFIIGAQKAGTTSLKNYLGEHPEITSHIQKEFAYFYDDVEYAEGYENAFKKYFGKPKPGSQLIAKNAGLYFKAEAIKRLKEHNPKCKIIFILRNPIERTYSAYNMEKNYASLDEPFEHIVDVLKEGDDSDWKFGILIGMSRYPDYLKTVYENFPRAQVKIIKYEDLKNNAQTVCRDCFEWLGVDKDFRPDTEIKYNVTTKTRSPAYGKFVRVMLDNKNPIKRLSRKLFPGNSEYLAGELLRNINKTKEVHGEIPEEVELKLLEYFKPLNDRLSEMTQIDFSEWNNPKVKKSRNVPNASRQQKQGGKMIFAGMFTGRAKPKISYSQSGEDLIVQFIFNALGIEKPSYIDVGAFDPQFINNTLLFYENGSTGINIEPNPSRYKNFIEQRPRDKNLQIGVTDISGKSDFYIMEQETLSTFSKKEAGELEKEHGIKLKSTIQVPTKTIADIINGECKGIFPDFLNLDVEGMDLEVIQTMNKCSTLPKVICAETVDFSPSGFGIKNQNIIDSITEMGFRVYADTFINTIFLRNDLWKK